MMSTDLATHGRAGDHRNWPIPQRRPAMHMVWHDLLFAHWPVPLETLRPHIPERLEIDSFEGVAWLGVVPFRMAGVRPVGCPAIGWLSDFSELNVRTYVTADDRPGVWFFSLDAAQPIAVWLARRWFHLPYFNARIDCRHRGDNIVYQSKRTHRGGGTAALAAEYGPTGPPRRTAAGTLEHWFTARYCLYAANRQGSVFRGDIDHDPWPLQSATARFDNNTMTDPLGIELPDESPILHFAQKLDVVAWSLQRID